VNVDSRHIVVVVGLWKLTDSSLWSAQVRAANTVSPNLSYTSMVLSDAP